MILSHQKFEYNKKCLIEKIIIQAPFRFMTNLQNEACFIYFKEGKTKINSPLQQDWVDSKESILLKCGTYFTDLLKYGSAQKYEILVFHLYPDVLREIYATEIPSFIKSSPNKYQVQKIIPQDLIEKFVENLYFYFDNPDLVSDDLIQLKIKELILILIQTKNASSVLELFSDLFTPRNTNVKEVVNNHLFNNISIDDLAKLCNLSTSTFNRTFRTLYNDTAANYIKFKRLERAKELLSVSSLTVSEIAFQTCFTDVAHLSRSFKVAYNYTPSGFRASKVLDSH